MITRFKARWKGLVSKVQHERGLRFKKKPSLKLGRGKPRNQTWMVKKGKHVEKVTRAKIILPRKLVATFPEKFAAIPAKHELRENLAIQNGTSPTEAHRYASRRTRGDTRRALTHHHRRVGLNYYLPFAVPPFPSLEELFSWK